MIKYNFSGLNLDNPEIDYTRQKAEYYLTLSVILEEQIANNCMERVIFRQKELLNIINSNLQTNNEEIKNNMFHIYKENELHFSLINFYTFSYNNNETSTSAFQKFEEIIKNSELVEELKNKIENTFHLYKIRQDFYNAKMGIIHTGDGSIATQVFIGESLINFCDYIVRTGERFGFPDVKAKIYPEDSTEKCRCALNILKIFKKGFCLIKENNKEEDIKKKIIEWNKKDCEGLPKNLLPLKFKKFTLNISDPYLSQEQNKYYRISEFKFNN
jgi:hypothetical protein